MSTAGTTRGSDSAKTADSLRAAGSRSPIGLRNAGFESCLVHQGKATLNRMPGAL